MEWHIILDSIYEICMNVSYIYIYMNYILYNAEYIDCFDSEYIIQC